MDGWIRSERTRGRRITGAQTQDRAVWRRFVRNVDLARDDYEEEYAKLVIQADDC